MGQLLLRTAMLRRAQTALVMAQLLHAAAAGSCGFVVSGGLGTDDRTGVYRQTSHICDGKPTYQRTTGTGYALISTAYGWLVGSADRLTDCANTGGMDSVTSDCDFPDGTSCPGGWNEWNGAEWVLVSSLRVDRCTTFADGVCRPSPCDTSNVVAPVNGDLGAVCDGSAGMIEPGATCDLTCDDGYYLSNQPTCTVAGELSSSTATCKPCLAGLTFRRFVGVSHCAPCSSMMFRQGATPCVNWHSLDATFDLSASGRCQETAWAMF